MEADESKVKALENIFGGDITASVIRTVLTTNDNKFDEAVDSLLNMSNDTINKNNSTKPKEEEEDEALLERKQRDKIRTLENMFGNDLSNSVICTVLESNKGELVDTVDTLLNMTSKDINPYQVEQVNQGEAERLKHEEELRDYEQFKALQLKLQEEEVKAMQEAKRKSDESAALKAQEERKRKEMMEEQERLIREFESQKKAQEAETQAKLAEQEKKRAELVQAQQKLAVLEKKKEEEEARRKNEEEARRKELAIQEKQLRLKAQEQEEALLEFRREEERKINEKKLQLEELVRQAEKQKAEEAARMQEEVLKKEKALQAMFEAQKLKEREIETQRILMEEEKLREKIDSERQAHLRKLEEERVADQKRRALEEERISLQRERELVEEMRREQENKSRLKAEAKARKEEAQRIALEHEKRLAMEAKARQEEGARLAEESRIRREEEQRRMEQERLEREEAEQRRAEQERARQAEEAARLKEEEARHAILREEANRQALLIEEERRKKLAYDQIAASAVFIPPKSEVVGDAITVTSEVSGDLVTCTWDIPEGNAAVTNWLGLYPSHQPLNTNKYVQFVYTNGSSTGQHVFRGVTPGHYEVRFFNTRGYEHAARGPKIRVGPSATLMCQLQGDHLRAHYTLDPLSTTPTREWLGIYEKTQRRNKKYLSSAYGNAEGQVLLRAPRVPGVYEVRLFAAGAVYNDQARMEFVVEDNDCINVESSFVNAGANVNVNWVLRTLEPSSSDWIGLYRADEANNTNYLSSTYTQGSSVGSIAIQAPKEVGVYEFRLFVRAKGKYTTFRTSQPLTVIPVV